MISLQMYLSLRDVNAPTISVHHDVLFRFGSWCYAGRVQLTPTLTLSDIPFVIPALRMQQSRYTSVPIPSPSTYPHIPHTPSLTSQCIPFSTPLPPPFPSPNQSIHPFSLTVSYHHVRLDYYCDVAAVPTNSPFASCLSYIQRLEPLIEREIYESEEALQGNGIG